MVVAPYGGILAITDYPKEVYENFLGEPGSHIAHEILHTSYKASHLSK